MINDVKKTILFTIIIFAIGSAVGITASSFWFLSHSAELENTITTIERTVDELRIELSRSGEIVEQQRLELINANKLVGELSEANRRILDRNKVLEIKLRDTEREIGRTLSRIRELEIGLSKERERVERAEEQFRAISGSVAGVISSSGSVEQRLEGLRSTINSIIRIIADY
jgi:chromosome segregation ATPase